MSTQVSQRQPPKTDSSGPQEFVYQPLEPSRPEIRLLKLYTGEYNDEIHCDLVHVSLSDQPFYEALSYTWGDAIKKSRIWLGGCSFSATVNLEIALRYLRKSNEIRTLWVDALCINQADNLERTMQVQKMRDIFWSAHGVLAWTGESSEDSDKAMEIIRLLGQPDIAKRIRQKTSQVDELSEFEYDSTKWHSFFKFLTRPYWSRVWVIQELAIPGTAVDSDSEDGIPSTVIKRVQVGCGLDWIPISTYNIACLNMIKLLHRHPVSNFLTEWYTSSPTNLIRSFINGLAMVDIVWLCIPTDKREKPSIRELLVKTSLLKATDARDRVYALLALARDADQSFIPDYSISMGDMLRNLIHHLITIDKNLMVLSGNKSYSLFDFPARISSWTPNPANDIVLSEDDWNPQITPFKASCSQFMDVKFSEDLRHLTCKGILIDRVAILTRTKTWESFLEDFIRASSLDELEVMAGLENHVSTNFGDEHNNFWHILLLQKEDSKLSGMISSTGDIEKWFNMLLDPNISIEMKRKVAAKLYYATATWDRCFYETASGKLGVGPLTTQKDDLVTILYGGQYCYILRGKGSRYEFVGDAYLHGVMNGELFDPENHEERSKYEEKDFVLK